MGDAGKDSWQCDYGNYTHFLTNTKRTENEIRYKFKNENKLN